MKLPRMNETERAIFVAAYMRALDRSQPRFDNEQAECALDDALGHMQNFRQAVRERDE